MSSISPDLVERVEFAARSVEDLVGGLGSGEEPRFGVVPQQVVVDSDLRDEAFDEVQPGRAGGPAVLVDVWVARKLGLHLGRLAGGVVAVNQMHVMRFRDGSIDLAEEGQELPGAVAEHAIGDDQTRLDVQRGEERRAMALFIVGHRRCPPFLQGQPTLGPVERLDPGLLFDTEHHGPILRVEVEPGAVGDLLHDIALQPRIRPYPSHARRRHANRFGHRRAVPARGIGRRRLLHGFRDHLHPDLPGKQWYARGCPAGFVALYTWNFFIEALLLSAQDCRRRHTRPSLRWHQHHICPSAKLAPRVAGGQQGLKLSAVGGAKVKAYVGSSHPLTMQKPRSVGAPMSGGEE